MDTTAGEHPQQVAGERRLRMWPGIAIVVLIVLVRYVIPFFIPEADFSGVLVGVAGAALILIWWLFFSRAPWSERIGVLFVIAAAVIVVQAAGACVDLERLHGNDVLRLRGAVDRGAGARGVGAVQPPAFEPGPMDDDDRHDIPGVRCVDAAADQRDHR